MGKAIVFYYLCLVVCGLAELGHGKINTDVRQDLKRLSELQEVKRSSDDCGDIHNKEECERRAQEGECIENKVWMSNNCKESCELCNGGSPVDVNAGCVDKHPRCGEWALKEECYKNPGWMKRNCKRSCRQCIFK